MALLLRGRLVKTLLVGTTAVAGFCYFNSTTNTKNHLQPKLIQNIHADGNRSSVFNVDLVRGLREKYYLQQNKHVYEFISNHSLNILIIKAQDAPSAISSIVGDKPVLTLPVTGTGRVVERSFKVGSTRIMETVPYSQWQDLQQEELRHILRGKNDWSVEPKLRGKFSQYFHRTKYEYHEPRFHDKPLLVILVFDGHVDKKLQEVFDYCKRENIFLKPVILQPNHTVDTILSEDDMKELQSQAKHRLVSRFLQLEKDDYYNKGKEEGYNVGEAYGRAAEKLKFKDYLEKEYARGFEDGRKYQEKSKQKNENAEQDNQNLPTNNK